jgi:hypothetical protein
MTTTAPTFSQVKAQVAAIRKKVPKARVIGIRAPGRWAGQRMNQDGDETYLIEQCDSPLAMRIALREEVGPKAIKVLITDLDDRELSDDIRLRLAKRQLFPIDPWQIVKTLFQAHAVDPRVTEHRWIADCLIESIPAGGYPSAAGGFLDAETVWPILLRQVIGLTTDRPDLPAILRWSTGAEEVERFRSARTEFREAAVAWLSETAGPAAVAVFGCVAANQRPDALPAGLAAGVVFSPQAQGKLERAAGKMEERFLERATPDERAISRWAEAATEVVRLQVTDPRSKKNLLERADEILRDVGAEDFAYLSPTSPLGFNQRLERFGAELARVLERKHDDPVASLASARAELGDHELAVRERRRLERADMAVRLVRWLRLMEQERPDEARSLVEAAKLHATAGGFVDWARLALRLGDPVRRLSEAYSKLFERATEVREAQARHFAELLRAWVESNSESPELTPVERILETFVAPLATHSPVLLVVVDGMSVAVAHELLGDLVGHDWVPLNRVGQASLLSTGLATVPSVTEVSRTSLFCGELRQGTSSDERNGFAAHPALRAVSRAGHAPVLFHKPSLRDEGDSVLSAEVREQISSPNRRVVGVVVNAVDDQLLKGEQIDLRWSRDSIPVLPALLHEAKLARRIVVITSDHGHVLDSRTEFRAHEGGERWRVADGPPDATEVQVTGRRVVIPESKSVIVPWSERVRYGVKKNGYHGGVTPQEMVVPIAVLSPTDSLPEGWVEVALEPPSWWEEPAPLAATTASSPSRVKVPPAKQTKLAFDAEVRESQITTPAESTGTKTIEWVEDLLRSPIFGQQRKLAGRSVPSDDVFRGVLVALDQRGKLTSAALARALNYPAMRLRGLLALVQRVLNIEGYAVLMRDEASDTVELNRELLKRQFELR